MLYQLSYVGDRLIEKCSPAAAKTPVKPAGEHSLRRIEWRTRPAI